MIGAVDKFEKKPPIRIAGYLEKRGKMRMLVCRWRRWWFVLEGRLLLYYRSARDCRDGLSPCRGTVNLGLAQCVRPGRGRELTLVLRSHTVTLRAVNKAEHEMWLQSLVDAMALPHCPSSALSRPVNHFRYTRDNQDYIEEWARSSRQASFRAPLEDKRAQKDDENSLSSSNSSELAGARSERSVLRRVLSARRPLPRNPESSAARLSKIAFSDNSIPVTLEPEAQNLEREAEKSHSLQDLRRSVLREGSSESPSESGTGLGPGAADREVSQKARGRDDKESKEARQESRSDEGLNGLVDRLDSNRRSKSDGSLIGRKIRRHSSCRLETQDRSIGPTFLDSSCRIDLKDGSDSRSERKPKKKRSQSFLARIRDNGETHSFLARIRDNGEKRERNERVGEPFQRRGTIKKRLSFLKRIWRRKEKAEADFEVVEVHYDPIPVVIELPSPEVLKDDKLLLPLNNEDKLLIPLSCFEDPEPEPPPDYDLSFTEEVEDGPPELPPRHSPRPVSPDHDVPSNNRPVETPSPPPAAEPATPPPLPVKRRLNRQLSRISEEMWPVPELDARQPKEPEPDYDVPRPHTKLMAAIRPASRGEGKGEEGEDSFAPTHFLCAPPLDEEEDSLDMAANRLEEMTPDSLECESTWGASESGWTQSFASDSDSLHPNYASDDTRFRDSLSS